LGAADRKWRDPVLLRSRTNLVFQDIDAIREFAQEGVDIEVNRDEDGSEG
jgi:hypothetical protein